MEDPPTDLIWQDREVRFDLKPQQLSCRKGEKNIDSINSVEDTKGNNGERGSLVVTNLRLLWISHNNSRINLSIGFNTIVSVNIRKAKSKLRGHTQALCVLAKFIATKYEFVFTSLVKNSPRLFTTVQAVLRSYESSRLYRDIKLRGSILRDEELITLPLEQIFTKVTGVWNLSAEQGNLGTLYITNVRIVWHANLANNFNVSLPYWQIKTIRARESKFGRALVVETFVQKKQGATGEFILGFRIDPPERLDSVTKELLALHRVFSENPIFGVEYSLESETPTIETLVQPKVEEDTDLIDDNDQDDIHAVAAYYVEAGSETSKEMKFDHIEYDTRLGLAIERLHEGLTIEQLWKVV